MMSLSNSPTRFFLLFGLGLTIGTTTAIAQSQSSKAKPVPVENCTVHLIDVRELAAPVPGVLDFVTPEEGDDVTADQLIAGLKSDVLKAEKAVADKEKENDVEIRYARKAAEQADTELRKALEANRRLEDTVPQVEVDRLKLAAERAHLQIEQAEHQLAIAALKAEAAEANIKIYQIPSPIVGTVTQRFKSPGEAVSQGEPILRIESGARLKVEGLIDIKDMFGVERGDRVKVEINIPGLDLPKEQRVLYGVLKLKGLSVEPILQKVRVIAEVQNPNDVLKAGLPVTMVILPGTAEEIQTTQVKP